jgi:hypothetical protein
MLLAAAVDAAIPLAAILLAAAVDAAFMPSEPRHAALQVVPAAAERARKRISVTLEPPVPERMTGVLLTTHDKLGWS